MRSASRKRERYYHLFGWTAAGLSFVSGALGYVSEALRLATLALAFALFLTALVVRGGP